MQTSSLELSKELYELTNWEDTDYTWFDQSLAGDPSFVEHSSKEFELIHIDTITYPAYTLGYLLSKLPYKIGNGNSSIWFRLGKEIRSYSVGYIGSDLVFSYDFNADTPEDAVCELAIELFKQGVLKK